MYTIEEHIKFIFYLKKEVVIPLIGRFYSKYINCSFSTQKNIIYPKKKEILFSCEQQNDDYNLLIKYISKKDNITKEKAISKVNEYTNHIKFSLKNTGSYQILNLGFLFYRDEKIYFQFNKNSNFNIDTYGLKPLKISEGILSDSAPIPISIKKPKISHFENNIKFIDEFYNVKLTDNYRGLDISWNRVLKTITIIYFLFALGYLYTKYFKPKVDNQQKFFLYKSAILDLSFLFDYNINKDSIKTKKNLINTEVYHVIIASFKSQDIHKVKKFISKFIKKNKQYNNKIYVLEDTKTSTIRISIGKFLKKEMVEQELKKIRPLVPDSWVYTTKK